MKNIKPISPAKSALIQLSNIARKAVESGQADSVNQFLVALHAEAKDCQPEDFKTFNQWKEAGFMVVKGSKASMLWAAPRKSKTAAESEGSEDAEKAFRFWPTCNLFAPSDVAPIEQKAAA